MLLAPFSVSDCQRVAIPLRISSRSRSAAPASAAPPTWLLLWAVGGGLILAAMGMLHGYAGHSLMFWLLGAPMIDLAWLAMRRARMLRAQRRLANGGRVSPRMRDRR